MLQPEKYNAVSTCPNCCDILPQHKDKLSQKNYKLKIHLTQNQMIIQI